jgi:hypothetical protein
MNVNKNYPALHVFVVDLIPSVLWWLTNYQDGRAGIMTRGRQYKLIEQHTNKESLKERLNGDGQQFHQWQQNKQSPITTSTEH